MSFGAQIAWSQADGTHKPIYARVRNDCGTYRCLLDPNDSHCKCATSYSGPCPSCAARSNSASSSAERSVRCKYSDQLFDVLAPIWRRPCGGMAPGIGRAGSCMRAIGELDLFTAHAPERDVEARARDASDPARRCGSCHRLGSASGRRGVRLGLQADLGAGLRVVGEDVGEVGQLVRASSPFAIALVGRRQLLLLVL